MNMDIIKDLAEIIKDEKEHSLTVTVDGYGVTVELIYPSDYDDDLIIPIRYEVLEEFVYIPDNEYREKFKPTDYGIDRNEIEMIAKIMEYLESHKDEINAICAVYNLSDRKDMNASNNITS